MELYERCFNLFPSLNRAYGTYTLKGKKRANGKQEGKAETKRGEVNAGLWDNHLSGKQGLGLVPITDDCSCRWGAIDIDSYEDFDLDKLADQVKELGLPLIVCRTKSGGAHLYIFITEEIEAVLLRNKLMEWTVALGRTGVEIFPKQVALTSERDTGNWINMPYFGGDETERYAVYDGKKLSLEEFLDFAESMQISVDALVDISPPIPKEVEDYFPRDDAPPCLQSLAAQGGIPEGSRNNGLLNIGVFLRKKYGDEGWQGRLDEYNHKFINPPLGSTEVEGVKKTLLKKDYQYRCSLDPIVGVCNKQICLTRQCGIGYAEDSGVDFGGMQKVTTVPPLWIWTINGQNIELTTEQIINQKMFERRVMEELTILVYGVSPVKWKEIVRKKLETAEIVPAAEDATPAGEIKVKLQQYLTETPPAEDRDELALGKPWSNKGKVYFSAPAFHTWLRLQRMNHSLRSLWALMRSCGVGHEGLKLKDGFKNFWWIAEFERQTEEFVPPEMADKEDF